MAAVGQYVGFSAGQCLYQEGGNCDHFALVGRGSLRVFKTASTGHEMTLYHVKDGEACSVNMLSIFLQRPAMATAVVEVPTEVVLFPAISFRNWVDSSHVMRKFVFEGMAVRLMDVMVLAEELMFRRVDRRLARSLLDRFSAKKHDVPVMVMNYDELAIELGTAREVVGRLLTEFERLGAIGVSRGQIKLLDKNILLQFVAQPAEY